MTQIATTIEQSQRLLELGVSAETADMVHKYHSSFYPGKPYALECHRPVTRANTHLKIDKLAMFAKNGETGEEIFDRMYGKDVPAWSLLRLREIVPNNLGSRLIEMNYTGQTFEVFIMNEPYDKEEVIFDGADVFQNLVDALAYLVDCGYKPKDHEDSKSI